MSVITDSLRDIYRIGPGPSSSHTLGPMRAAGMFLTSLKALVSEDLARGKRVRATFFGSLAATGYGHASHLAVIAGLTGQEPETCPPDLLPSLDDPEATHALPLPTNLTVSLADVLFDPSRTLLPHPNTLVLELLSEAGDVLFAREFASVGGGFLDWPGKPEPPTGDVVHPFSTMTELKALLKAKDLRLHECLLQNEEALTGLSRPEILARLDRVLAVMEEAVTRGLAAEGLLPGELKLHRKARALLARSAMAPKAERFLLELSAAALAVAEENAAGHVIVTAPTAGAAGVLPAVVHVLRRFGNISRENIRNGLVAAGAVAMLARKNASISGAALGCQAETGVASAMAAALAAYASGHRFLTTENAAESALEHHLGLVCDPVRGYVQIPCIERNSMAAVKAYNAYLIAAAVPPERHLVDLDRAIRAMQAIGDDMHVKYKETGLGGLADWRN